MGLNPFGGFLGLPENSPALNRRSTIGWTGRDREPTCNPPRRPRVTIPAAPHRGLPSPEFSGETM